MNNTKHEIDILLSNVRCKEGYRAEELKYVEKVLDHVLQLLDDKSEQLVQSILVKGQREKCFLMSRGSMIINRQLNIVDSARFKHNNRFISAQMQWLCVLLVRFFRFPYITHAQDLVSTPTCDGNYPKKLNLICCNVNHFELAPKVNQSGSRLIAPVGSHTVSANNSNNISYPSAKAMMGFEGEERNYLDIEYVEHSPEAECISDSVMEYEIERCPWAEIQYHERELPKGCAHVCYNEHPSVSIDTGTCPIKSSTKFCINSLDQLSDDPDIVRVRNQIAGGIVLTKVCGKVFLDNNTTHSCFYQSWIGVEIMNEKLNTSYHRATVIKVLPGYSGIPVFDLKHFAADLEVVATRYQEAIIQFDPGRQQMALDELNRMESRCIFRICLEGYGEEFEPKFIRQTNVWFEVKMAKALHWLELVKNNFIEEATIANSYSIPDQYET